MNKQVKFVKEFDQLINTLTGKHTVMFMDGVHPLHNSVCSKVWSIKGETKWIESNTGRDRLNINGAYNYFNQDVIYRIDPSINADSTIELLKQVSEKYNHLDKVFVYGDNARANKCKAVKEWLSKQKKIVLRYIPPYSPNLNLIERLWKYMRRETMNAKYYPVFTEFKTAITNFFDNIDQHKENLESFIGRKFQIFKTDLII